jgi:hypothetical protein
MLGGWRAAQPAARPGQQWAAVSGKNKEPGRAPQRRLRATYIRIAGVRHLFAAYELARTSRRRQVILPRACC